MSNKISLRALLLILVAAAAGGCTDVTAIKTFSSLPTGSSDYAVIVHDYVDSTVREERYNPGDTTLQSDITEAKADEKSLLAMQKAVADYLAAVGKLAGDQQSAPSKATGSLVDSVTQTHLISSADKDSVGALADIVTRLVTSGYQNHELKQVVEEANRPLQELLGSLEKFTHDEYPARLAAEEGNLKQTLSENIALNSRLGADQQPVKVIASFLYSERSVDLETKEKASEDFAAVFEKIGKAHQALYDHRDHLDAADLISQIKSYASDIGKAVK